MARKKDASPNNAKKKSQQGLMFAVAFILTLFCIGTGSYVQELDMVQVGSVAEKRYVAEADAVDEVATNKLKEAAADSVAPIYKHDSVVEEESRTEVNELFEDLNSILASLKEADSFYEKAQAAPWKLPVLLTEKELNAYAGLDSVNRILFAEDCLVAMNQVYAEGITADALEEGRAKANEAFASTAWSSSLKEMANSIFEAGLEPNLLPDEAAMEAAREEKRAEVDDVMIRKNQKIVDEGEIITQDIYDRLVSLNLIGGADYRSSALPLMGSMLMVGLLFVALYLFFTWSKGAVVLKKNEVKMLFSVYVLMIILLRLMANIPYFTLIPLGLFAMLASLLAGRRVALVMNTLFCIIGCFIFNGDVQFLMYSLLVGTLGALLIQKTDKRQRMVPIAVAMGIVSLIAMFGVGLFFDGGYSQGLMLKCLFAAVMGLVSVVIAVGSLPFWEATFEANTPLRLLELTNPNNELLRRLMLEAPGTYHHSLIVANLAETAAYEIGANTALARAGAYYHDIGKLKNPQMFSENQSGYNPHDDLAPETSAKIITQHPKNGVEMGLEYGLPRIIIDVIREHHGTSLVKFFYFKALKAYGAENVTEAEYRYQGTVPTSRESAVVMLADTVEAAVRSILGSGKTLEEAEGVVKTLIKDKLDDGQLDHSGLGIHELEIIRKAFLKVFHGMYHERVAYPKQEEIDAAAKKGAVEEKREEENSESTDR
ncbi:HD family phosphohydrolase [Anaerotignum sp.]|nr:HDIG domain-containing metalloprotein [Anaerotignum sp.]MBQ7758218.1 HDIG domain-containing protein [Anaerotignum sp.]